MTPEQQSLVEDLFARYSRGVGSFVLARVGDADVAEEVVSRVFLKVVGAIEQCRESPAAWLWSIVRNELAMHFRALKNRPGDRPLHALDGSPFEPRAPEARAEQAETQDRMARALRQLPDELQQLVWMKFYQEMSNTEIAEATGLKPGHIGVLVHRGIKQLRALMEETSLVPPIRSASHALKTELRTVLKEDNK